MMRYGYLNSVLLMFLLPTIGWASFDVHNICTDVGRNAAMGGMQYECSNQTIDTMIFDYGTETEIRDYLQTLYCDYSQALFPWLLLNHPRIEVQNVAIELQLTQAKDYLDIKTYYKPDVTVQSFLEETVKSSIEYSEEAKQETIQKIEKLKKSPEFEKNEGEAKKAAAILCLPYLSLGCGQALPELIDFLSPRYSNKAATISIPTVTERVLTDPKFVRGAAYAALHVLERIQDAKNRHFSDGYVFSDLFLGYKDAGLRDEEAMDYTWDLLAFYATRGASIDVIAYDIFNDENYPLAVALYVISAGMTYLDYANPVLAETYSYPPTVQSTCNHGRPYHFWMSAYFTRYLKKRGYTERAAILASYLSGMLYEFSGVTWGRDPMAPYKADLYSTTLNTTRANLAVHSVGSIFGARLNTMHLSLDEDLQIMLRSSHQLPVISDSDMEVLLKDMKKRYLAWLYITGADANIRIF